MFLFSENKRTPRARSARVFVSVGVFTCHTSLNFDYDCYSCSKVNGQSSGRMVCQLVGALVDIRLAQWLPKMVGLMVGQMIAQAVGILFLTSTLTSTPRPTNFPLSLQMLASFSADPDPDTDTDTSPDKKRPAQARYVGWLVSLVRLAQGLLTCMAQWLAKMVGLNC